MRDSSTISARRDDDAHGTHICYFTKRMNEGSNGVLGVEWSCLEESVISATTPSACA